VAAIRQACLLRLRPILMTTMAALLGALPLMLGTGVGSELRHPLGITMVGGLLVSQVLTLFHATPVIYLAFDRAARRWRGRRHGQVAAGREWRMNISAPFIARPVATTLLAVGVLLAGVVAFSPASRGAVAAGRLSHYLGAGQPTRRESRETMAATGSDAARARAWAHLPA